MNETTVTLLKWLGVFVLVFLNGFFVAAEFALVKVRESRLRQLAYKGTWGASMGLHILQHINAYLSACQLGITLASLGLGWLAESALSEFFVPVFQQIGWGSASVHMVLSGVIVFTVITFLHIVVGEQAPKVFAIQNPETTTTRVAWPLRLFYFLIYPGNWVLNTASLGLLKWMGIQKVDEHEMAPTPEELQFMLKQSSQSSQLTPVAGSLLLNALDLRRRKARQVMVHRTKIAFLSAAKTLKENLQTARQSGFSRFPICEGSVDRVIGMVHLKDLTWLREQQGEQANILTVRRDVLFVPENLPLERLLNLFLTRRVHMAILVDEYGTVVGMVTLENILEEIVGDMGDKVGEESLMFEKMGPREYRLQGELPLHDLEPLLGIHLDGEDVTTVGGFLMEQLGRIPDENEVISIKSHEFIVTRVSGHRIAQVIVRKPEESHHSDSLTAGRSSH